MSDGIILRQGIISGDGSGLTNIPISGTSNLQTQLDTKIETAYNVGGANNVFSGKSGTDLQFRTISGGSNTTVTTVGDVIKIDATGGGGGSGIVYIASGTTQADLLDDTNNWDINGEYTGTTITGTFQGYAYYNSDYWFTAVDDNEWIRLIRG